MAIAVQVQGIIYMRWGGRLMLVGRDSSCGGEGPWGGAGAHII
jgi:hypothetical protein